MFTFLSLPKNYFLWLTIVFIGDFCNIYKKELTSSESSKISLAH